MTPAPRNARGGPDQMQPIMPHNVPSSDEVSFERIAPIDPTPGAQAQRPVPAALARKSVPALAVVVGMLLALALGFVAFVYLPSTVPLPENRLTPPGGTAERTRHP